MNIEKERAEICGELIELSVPWYKYRSFRKEMREQYLIFLLWELDYITREGKEL